MQIQYANNFINAFSSVFPCFLVNPLSCDEIQMAGKRWHAGKLAVMIGMVGDINGQVYMSMSAKTGQELASRMMGGIEISETNELVTGAVCEICNMIMGNACSSISTENKIVDITPPTVIEDEYFAMLSDGSYTIPVVLEGLGTIEFDVAL